MASSENVRSGPSQYLHGIRLQSSNFFLWLAETQLVGPISIMFIFMTFTYFIYIDYSDLDVFFVVGLDFPDAPNFTDTGQFLG